MFGIPSDFDIACAVGPATTQVRVGEFDIGEVSFYIWSPIRLIKESVVIGSWRRGLGRICNSLKY